jgi:hypothetical protein
MDTTSLAAVYKGLRAHLLTFAPLGGGPTLADLLGTLPGAGAAGKLYAGAPQEGVTYPYGVLRFAGLSGHGAHRGNRRQGDLETMLYHRPRSMALALEDAADVYEQAMREFADATGGLVFSRAQHRDTVPPFQDPADRELVMVRLVHDVVIWPQFLTQYDT